MVLLERLDHVLTGKQNTAKRGNNRDQHVKAPLREDNGMVWAAEQPKTSDGVKTVKKGDKNPSNVPAIIL